MSGLLLSRDVFSRIYVVHKMDETSEQWACVKFCFKTGKTASETYELFKLLSGINVGAAQMFLFGLTDLKIAAN